ncbi:MAG: lactoylglutathione lyase [Crocinitomicaceae bacterium]|jgi:predicted enzyme related to lactoylglutathione lyase|nr:lactoylglutathione lyase [Crocinitomicaceae bacterium]
MGAKMGADTNALNWFEIAVTDLNRAQQFYESAFDMHMHKMDMEGMEMAMFPPMGEDGKVGGALVKSNMHKPSKEGSIVYLNANPDLQLVLDRINHLGAKTILPKTNIGGENGYMAFLEDSEGNVIGLHSNN